MKRILSTLFLLFATASLLSAQGSPTRPVLVTSDFEFRSGGRTLSGVIDQPAGVEARALIVFVHGSGMTDVRGENRYIDLRRRFAELGIASVVWDKPGMGRSEGDYDPNQRLAESAREVIDAVAYVRRERIPGSQKIGIWGTSRGGWVAPLAMAEDAGIEFWISVSGVPAADNKYYLLAANLPLEGRTPEQTARLLAEWRRGREIFMAGGSYDAYLAATAALRRDTSVFYFAGDLTGTREAWDAEQAGFTRTRAGYEFDENLSVLRVRGFDEILRGLDVDVLAIFGDRDTNVDWRAVRELYEETIGRNRAATLTVRTFAGCNHSMNLSATGSVREVEGTPLDAGEKCDGYYEEQVEWLRRYAVGEG